MENPTDMPAAVCWACGGKISAEDNYCRFCVKGQVRFIPWYYKHWGIIILTLFGFGPFSLFLVWRSPALSRGSKWAYTAAIAALTWYAALKLYHFWLALSVMLQPMLEMFNSMNAMMAVPGI